MNMKNPMNFFSNENSLYRMECKVISGILVCFIVSGIFLPTAKAHLPNTEYSEDPVLESSLPSGKTTDTKIKKETAKTPKSVLQDTVTEVAEIWEEAKQAKLEEKPETTEDTAVPEDAKTSEKPADAGAPANNSSSDTTNRNSVANNSHSSGGSSSQGSSSPSGNTGSSSSAPPADTQPPVEPPKVWVPPVYTTVHHEAIYETRRSVICNYCGAAFGSAGEFQVHKDANGG